MSEFKIIRIRDSSGEVTHELTARERQFFDERLESITRVTARIMENFTIEVATDEIPDGLTPAETHAFILSFRTPDDIND